MEQVGFVGAYDKKDLLLYVANVFTKLGLKVLIVDATSTQRFRYVVPSVNAKGISYVSEYIGIDVALGFMNLMGVANFLGTQNLPYDLVLIDTDNIQTFNSFGLARLKRNFLVTSYDIYEINKIMEILRNVPQEILTTKVIISADINNHQEKHFDHLIGQTKVKTTQDIVEIPDSTINRKQVLQNQIGREITFKKFDETFKNGLEYLSAIIMDCFPNFKISQANIKRVIRKF